MSKEKNETPENLLTEVQAAQLLGLAPRTLQMWRYAGKGPGYIRISARTVRYHRDSLTRWLEQQKGGVNDKTLR